MVIEVGPLLTVGSIAFTTARSFEDSSFGIAASGAGENVFVAYAGRTVDEETGFCCCGGKDGIFSLRICARLGSDSIGLFSMVRTYSAGRRRSWEMP